MKGSGVRMGIIVLLDCNNYMTNSFVTFDLPTFGLLLAIH